MEEFKEINHQQAIELIRSWKEKGARLSLTLTTQSNKTMVWNKVIVQVWNFTDSSISFSWDLSIPDTQSASIFSSAKGTFTVNLSDTSIFMIEMPKKSIKITRGDYECVVEVVRESTF